MLISLIQANTPVSLGAYPTNHIDNSGTPRINDNKVKKKARRLARRPISPRKEQHDAIIENRLPVSQHLGHTEPVKFERLEMIDASPLPSDGVHEQMYSQVMHSPSTFVDTNEHCHLKLPLTKKQKYQKKRATAKLGSKHKDSEQTNPPLLTEQNLHQHSKQPGNQELFAGHSEQENDNHQQHTSSHSSLYHVTNPVSVDYNSLLSPSALPTSFTMTPTQPPVHLNPYPEHILYRPLAYTHPQSTNNAHIYSAVQQCPPGFIPSGNPSQTYVYPSSQQLTRVNQHQPAFRLSQQQDGLVPEDMSPSGTVQWEQAGQAPPGMVLNVCPTPFTYTTRHGHDKSVFQPVQSQERPQGRVNVVAVDLPNSPKDYT